MDYHRIAHPSLEHYPDLVLYRLDGRRFETFVEIERRAEAERRQGREEGLQEGLQQGLQQGLQRALDRLIASGMAEDQARHLLGLT